jgi:hypothetical protein
MQRSIRDQKLRSAGSEWTFYVGMEPRTYAPAIFITQRYPSGLEQKLVVHRHLVPAFVAYLRRGLTDIQESH